jgi:hypothetical protein
MKVVSGYVQISEQLLRQSIECEAAIERHAERMDSDPEYAAEWLRGQDEREDDWDD